ncbi:MAG TPA: aminomethyl-transferring glycine dehydrogenase, partial [Phycisphaerae bacterium]|nr:aminomethyl-transferring glycine dehydrogenase [Phycisphaerae bacterium]
MKTRVALPSSETSDKSIEASFFPCGGEFVRRHIGPSEAHVNEMLATLNLNSLEELVEKTVPRTIRSTQPLRLPAALNEHEMLDKLRIMGQQNKTMRSLIGMGYYGCITAPVIRRNILENPGWYTQYTPYQSEISQGRLEALLNFQTMIADLTGLPIANASLLDEATAAAEAISMCHALSNGTKKKFFIAEDCHPQTIQVVQTRATGLGFSCVVGSLDQFNPDSDFFCVLVQYPSTDGRIRNLQQISARAHEHGAFVVVAADILALTLLQPPGEFDADIAVGNTQRLGMPMGYGGPHAAFMAAKELFLRKMPGRIVGISHDATGKPAYRLALQTREQHIRREKATSNICTAQVLPAVVAAMHVVYHGPNGLTDIARKIHGFTAVLAQGLRHLGHKVHYEQFFDTLRITTSSDFTESQLLQNALTAGFNLRNYHDGSVGLSLDERTTMKEVESLLRVFSPQKSAKLELVQLAQQTNTNFPESLMRQSRFLIHPAFNNFHNETDMQRYMRKLESRDLSLTTSMIPLGSCTMKLNAAAEMLPITWPRWADIHPFAPAEQTAGYSLLLSQLESMLCEITGFSAMSLEPNAGSQGEYAGLMVIRAYHRSLGQPQRDVCLIPVSAHGTNPASAIIAGLQVVTVACDENGNIDLADLKRQAEQYRNRLSCLIVTYPSTHGVFEESIQEICKIVHENGGQVYMDGANMNAQVGLCRPADIGADVCHLNLHKTFCIPHGGGGPGMGPIGVAEHLAPFLPAHSDGSAQRPESIGAISAAPFGSALILIIPWAYINMMGADGLTRATQVAILNANYMAHRLKAHYPIRFTGRQGFCAHEFIIDAGEFEISAGIKVEDIAKRLMDYGFHAPTVSWPEPGAMMIEPTESESKPELDRFCDALIEIRDEIRRIELGEADRKNNVLKNAPHTAQMLAADPWPHPYSRKQAAYPLAYLEEHKFWPATARIDNPYG